MDLPGVQERERDRRVAGVIEAKVEHPFAPVPEVREPLVWPHHRIRDLRAVEVPGDDDDLRTADLCPERSYRALGDPVALGRAAELRAPRVEHTDAHERAPRAR